MDTISPGSKPASGPGANARARLRVAYVPNTALTARELLAIAFRQRWKVLPALMIPPVLAVSVAFMLPKTYRGSSDILVKSGREYLPPSDGSGAGATAAPTTSKQEDIASEIAILGSRPVLEATIRKIGLEKMFPDIVESPPTNMSLMDAAVEQFSRSLGIDPVKMSNIVTVSFDAPSPKEADAVVNELIAQYLAKHTEVFAANRMKGYETATDGFRAQLAQLEQQRSRIKIENGIYDLGAQRAALITQRVDEEAHVQDVTNRQATLLARLAYLQTQRPRIANTAQSSNTDKSDDASHARQALIDLRQTEASMAARFGDSNPELQRVRAQIAALQGTVGGLPATRTNTSTTPSPLAQQVDQEIVMGNAELAPLPEELARYKALFKTTDAELRRLESADLDLRLVSTRIDLLTDNLKASQSSYEQARTEEQTALARQVSVVQIAPAIAPERAVKPKKIVFAAGGVLFGLLISFAILVIAVLTNKTIATEEAAERLIGLPVLAAVPNRRRGAVSALEAL